MTGDPEPSRRRSDGTTEGPSLRRRDGLNRSLSAARNQCGRSTRRRNGCQLFQADPQSRSASHDFAGRQFQIIHNQLPGRVARDLQRDDRTGSEPAKCVQRHPPTTQTDRSPDRKICDARQVSFECSASRPRFQFQGCGFHDHDPVATSAATSQLSTRGFHRRAAGRNLQETGFPNARCGRDWPAPNAPHHQAAAK